MRLPSLSKSKSDVSGQSGHALPDCYQPFVPRSDMPSGIFLRKRSCDFARAIDEKLRHRTRFAVL